MQLNVVPFRYPSVVSPDLKRTELPPGALETINILHENIKRCYF